jgi:hypothetical protein
VIAFFPTKRLLFLLLNSCWEKVKELHCFTLFILLRMGKLSIFLCNSLHN